MNSSQLLSKDYLNSEVELLELTVITYIELFSLYDKI